MGTLSTTKVGIIGCGKICGIYFKNGQVFQDIEMAACADLLPGRAQQKAEEFGVPKACSVEELLRDPEISIILNLTTPDAHYAIATAALNAGKSVYNEKPLTLSREQGADLLALANKKGLRVGCAPDTFLGASIQTCRKLIDDGWIGEPVAANAFMGGRGPESWHPDPEFYYKTGGGPMFDMGPYYLTALVNLIGPVARVCAMTRTTFPERIITSPGKFGNRIAVEVPTHIIANLAFDNGALGTLTTSFDLWKSECPRIEIHGTEGSLSVGDPNKFGDTPMFCRGRTKEWQPVPLAFGYEENSRGIGVADMACALRTGRDHRASGEMAFHVLDIMHAIHESADERRERAIESTCSRPQPLPLGLLHGSIDLTVMD